MQKSVLDQIQAQAYQLSVDSVVTALGTHPQQGLSESQAQERLKIFGRNELAAEGRTPGWKKFLEKFKDTFVLLLLFATTVSLGIWAFERETPLPYEAITIFAVVLLNAIMSYVQESRAESAVAALRQMAAPHAHVVRQGRRRSIPAAELVVGDLMLLEEGDSIPADARLLQSVALQTKEAALTGESLPALKDVAPLQSRHVLGDQHNMVFSGTSVSYGRGRAVVVGTGMRTEMGRIAGMLRQVTVEATPLQKELDRVGRILAFAVVIIALLMIATILVFEHVSGFAAIVQVLILSVALAVAAVPEGLPTIVTAVLATGVRRMAKRQAIVRRLSAVETLGSANVIASDKTGTLTRNEMTVRRIITANGRIVLGGTGYVPEGAVHEEDHDSLREVVREELQKILAAADRANNAVLQQKDGIWMVQGDPTEGALVVAARKVGLDADRLESRFERIGEIPFSSERKLMSTVHSDSDQQERFMVFTKGAPDLLLARCTFELCGGSMRPLSEHRRREILQANEEMAGEAMRTLGVAFRALSRKDFAEEEFDESVETELVFAGLVGMIDPPREEAKAAVDLALKAGVRPIMITGDHARTAGVIAQELGLSADGLGLTGMEIDRMSDDELERVAGNISVYARVNPEHKLRIVRALQKQGAIVAMTGDGVNDAPALKMADIGIAMGITGTDAAKEAADMVLADDNFATVVKAVESGRTIFSNIQKCLRYLLSSNIGEVLTMFFGVILSGALGLKAEGSSLVLPILATQLLWINLVTDGLPAFALGLDPGDSDVMVRPPRPASENVITRRMWSHIILGGSVMAIGTLAVLDLSLPGGWIEGNGTMPYAQTMAFTTLMLFQMFNVFNARSDETSAFKKLWSNRGLWMAVAISLLLQVVVVHVPFFQQAFSTVSLNPKDWLLCTVIASSVLWIRELQKLGLRRMASVKTPVRALVPPPPSGWV